MSSERKKSARRYDVDWLRVLAVCVLVMIHTAAIFDPYPTTSVKGKPSWPLILFATFVHEWRLSVLFIVSGAGSYFALGFLTGREFVRSRFKRILIPLVAGTLLVVPFHLYYWQFLGNPGYGKSFPQFYASIMQGFFLGGKFGVGRESLHWAHLWFLFYLFVASLLALPLFLYLRREPGRRLVSRLASFTEKKGAIFLYALPLVLVEVILRPIRPGAPRLIIIDDWAYFCLYFIQFVYGFLIFSEERIRRALESHRAVALGLGFLTSCAYIYVTFGGLLPVKGYNLKYALFMVLSGFNIWFWCVAIFGYGGRYLNFNHRFLPFANAAVYPVYVLHLPIITVIASWVLRWPIGVAAQFTIIVWGTIGVSVAIYELIVRRTPVTRFLFGLKTKKSAPSDAPAPAAEAEATAKPVPLEEVAR